MQIEEGKILPDRTVFYCGDMNETNRKEWLRIMAFIVYLKAS